MIACTILNSLPLIAISVLALTGSFAMVVVAIQMLRKK